MSEKKRLFKNTMLITIGNLGTKIISFLLLPLYTTLLSTSEYGTYDFIITINVLLIPIITLSMHEALFRFIIDAKENNKEFKKIVTNSLTTVLVGNIFIFLIFLVIAILNKEHLSLIGYLYIITAANSLFMYFNNFLRGLGKIKEYTIISCAKNAIQIILNVITIVVFKLGINGLFVSLIVADMVGFIVIVVYSKFWRYVDLKLINRKTLFPMLKYALPLIPNALCAQIINLSDRFVIIGFMGTAYNGIYSISYKFPSIIETIYHYFYIAWSESASRTLLNGKEQAIKYYQSLHDVMNNFTFSSVILLISLMPLLFRILIKGEYVEGFKYVPILLLSIYFDCMAKFYSGIFTALKKTRIMATTTIVAAVINLIINIMLIKYIGLYAAAGSTLIAEFILIILRRRKLKKHMNLPLSKTKVLLMIVVSVSILLLYSYDNVILLLCSFILSTLYFIIANKKIIQRLITNIKYKLRKSKIA